MTTKKTVWYKIEDRKPTVGKVVFISDGKRIAVSSYRAKDDYWLNEGFGGVEWEWDFEPTHWADITIELPDIKAG